MSRARRWGWVLASIGALCLGGAEPARADTIRLKDGRAFHGKIAKREGGKIVFDMGGADLTLQEDQVAGVENDSEVETQLKRAQDLLGQGQLDEALAACDAAEKAGAAPSQVKEIRDAIAAKRTAALDPLKAMKPEARRHYDQALQLLDRTLVMEASDEMGQALALDPQNLAILRELLKIDYTLFLRGEIALASLQGTAQKLLAVAPDDAMAKRLMSIAQEKQYSREEDKKKTMDSLWEKIQKAKESGKLTPDLLDDVRQLRALGPDDSILAELKQIEAQLLPLEMAQSAGDQAKAPPSGAKAGAKKAPGGKAPTAAAKGAQGQTTQHRTQSAGKGQWEATRKTSSRKPARR
ncbi:MAG: hypothetical protein NTW86_03625 [Candidatus Sumerlaeota bacterium]|nr:hypothetical protein [Candidatus Sumerlaeota bacterium]